MADKKITADNTVRTNEGEWASYDFKNAQVKVITYKSHTTSATLATILANSKARSASVQAWAAARHSRSPLTTVEIVASMDSNMVDADQKLEETFKGYGHASVADLAPVMIHFNDVPLILPAMLFNEETTNAGQEKSTRFQNQYGKALLHPISSFTNIHTFQQQGADTAKLEQKYQELGDLALQNYNELKPKVEQAYMQFYKPDFNVKGEKGAFESRVLDTVRFNLILSQYTGFASLTSARNWARLISKFKASDVYYFRQIGDQIETFLAPSAHIESELGFLAEAPSLVRHTEGDGCAKINIQVLEKYLHQETDFDQKINLNKNFKGATTQSAEVLDRKYSVGTKMMMQYVLSIHPGADHTQVLDWLDNLEDSKKQCMSRIIYDGHNHHHELPTPLASTRDISVLFNSALGEARDFNRHRAWGRFLLGIPIFYGPKVTADYVQESLDLGFSLPLYIENVPEFNNLKKEMTDRFNKYYQNAQEFVESCKQEIGTGDDVNYTFALGTLPMAHNTAILMHGDPKQADYFVKLRVRPGGHINYRALAYDAAKLIKNSDPFLSGMELECTRPDPASRDEFFSRS